MSRRKLDVKAARLAINEFRDAMRQVSEDFKRRDEMVMLLHSFLDAYEDLPHIYPHWRCDRHGVFDARVAVGCPECVRTMRDTLRGTEPPSTCIWDYDDVLCSWDTACQNCFTFIDLDGPTENGMKFCCYCGKTLVEAPRDEEVDKAATDEVE